MNIKKKKGAAQRTSNDPKKYTTTWEVKSQTDRILEYMMKGRPLTQKQAIQYWECYRLSGRIHDLRAQGYDIKTTMMPNKKNGGTHASYRLVK